MQIGDDVVSIILVVVEWRGYPTTASSLRSSMQIDDDVNDDVNDDDRKRDRETERDARGGG